MHIENSKFEMLCSASLFYLFRDEKAYIAIENKT